MSTSIRFEAIVYPSLCEENRCFYAGTNTKQFHPVQFPKLLLSIFQFCQISETQIKLLAQFLVHLNSATKLFLGRIITLFL